MYSPKKEMKNHMVLCAIVFPCLLFLFLYACIYDCVTHFSLFMSECLIFFPFIFLSCRCTQINSQNKHYISFVVVVIVIIIDDPHKEMLNFSRIDEIKYSIWEKNLKTNCFISFHIHIDIVEAKVKLRFSYFIHTTHHLTIFP